MGRLEQVWGNLRRATEASRRSLRAAWEQRHARRAEQAYDQPPELETVRSAGRAQAIRARAVRGEEAAGGSVESVRGMEPPVAPPEEQPAEQAVPRSLQIAGAWSWRLIVVAAVGVGILWLANQLLLLVAPLMIGLLLTALLMPAQRALVRARLNRSIAALLVVIAGIAVVGGTLSLVINQFVVGLPDMVREVGSGISDVQDWLRNGPLGLDDTDLQNLIQEGQQWLSDNTEGLTSAGLTAVTGVVQFLTGMILTLVVTFFFLRDGRRIWHFLVGMLPARAHAPMAYAGEGGWRSLSGYVRATVLVAFVDAVGIGIGLWILDQLVGMRFVLPLAALVFLGGFVPIVGAFVSGGAAVLVALLDPPGTEGLIKAVVVLAIVLLVQQIESNVLQPFIVSRMVRIHPLAVIVAVTAGIMMAGILGALVAVPIVAVLNTLVRRLHAYHRLPPPEMESGSSSAAPSAPS